MLMSDRKRRFCYVFCVVFADGQTVMASVWTGFETGAVLVDVTTDSETLALWQSALVRDANALDGCMIARSIVVDAETVRVTVAMSREMRDRYMSRLSTRDNARGLGEEFSEQAHEVMGCWSMGDNIRRMPLTMPPLELAPHTLFVNWPLDAAAQVLTLIEDYPEILAGVSVYRVSEIEDDTVGMAVILTVELLAVVRDNLFPGADRDETVFAAIFQHVSNSLFPDSEASAEKNILATSELDDDIPF